MYNRKRILDAIFWIFIHAILSNLRNQIIVTRNANKQGKKLKPQSGLCDKPPTNQTEMTNLRELEEEIETYEGTSGDLKSKMYYNYVKENFLIPDDPHHNQKFNRNSLIVWL